MLTISNRKSERLAVDEQRNLAGYGNVRRILSVEIGIFGMPNQILKMQFGFEGLEHSASENRFGLCPCRAYDALDLICCSFRKT